MGLNLAQKKCNLQDVTNIHIPSVAVPVSPALLLTSTCHILFLRSQLFLLDQLKGGWSRKNLMTVHWRNEKHFLDATTTIALLKVIQQASSKYSDSLVQRFSIHFEACTPS